MRYVIKHDGDYLRLDFSQEGTASVSWTGDPLQATILEDHLSDALLAGARHWLRSWPEKPEVVEVPDQTEHDRIMSLKYQVSEEGRTFVEFTSDSTHCENCSSGCPGICSGYTHRQPSQERRLRICKTDEDRRLRMVRQ